MRIVEFDKGLNFLGVLFKSGTIAPAKSVVNKFKQRIHSLLNPREARSLLDRDFDGFKEHDKRVGAMLL
jgi:hypothetical protein